MQTLRMSNPIAVKDHECNYCCGQIFKGEKYERSVNVYDGMLYEWKAHHRCVNIARKLQMFDYADEGLTSSDFFQYIHDEFDGLNIDDGKKYSFHAKLDIVCEKHSIQR